MTWNALAAEKLSDMLRPREGGAVVNPNVVVETRIAGPDYEAMRRVLQAVEPGALGENEQYKSLNDKE
jgi:hypothetical protein